jgi:endoglucanase Acf2
MTYTLRQLLRRICVVIGLFHGTIQPAIIPVGAGGYTTTLPANQIGVSNKNGVPVVPKVTPNFSQVPMTHKPWSSLIWQFNPDNPWSENIFLHPVSLRAVATGLEVHSPTNVSISPDHLTSKGYNTTEYHYKADNPRDLTVGLENLNVPNTRVESYSDWAVTALWEGGGATLRATMGHGFPFVYFTKAGGNALIKLTKTPTVWYNQNGTIGLTIKNRHYGIFAPTGSTWSASPNLVSSLNGKNYFSVAVLPDNTVNTLLYFRKHAFTFVVNTAVDWEFDQAASVVTSSFTVQTELKEQGGDLSNQPLLGLYRHQWLNSDAAVTAYSYPTARGLMKIMEGTSFTTELAFNGVLPELPYVAVEGQNSFSKTQLWLLVDGIYNQTPAQRWGNAKDTYWFGKAIGKVSRLIHIAHQINHTPAKDLFLQELKAKVSSWLTGQGASVFYYDQTWKTLIGYPASYGSNNQLSDHHFHWGYFIMGAATIAQYDPQWAGATQWGGMVELLLKDAQNWDRTDTRFPFMRMFDPYEGHAWANGPALFGSGNNQEASSESMNFSTAMILWGTLTENQAIRDAGIYLYATEASAIEQYWFDVDNAVFPENFDRPTVAIVWSNGGAYAIWWDGYIEEAHGINFTPISGGSLYLGHYPDYLKMNQEYMATHGGGNDSWRDVHMNVTALYDPLKAIAAYNAGYTTEAGETKAHTYYWIHNLNTLGRVDPTITADTPLHAVFNKNGAKTYVVYNGKSAAATVKFSDGVIVSAPANSWYTSNGSVTPPPPPPPTDTPICYNAWSKVNIDNNGKLCVWL